MAAVVGVPERFRDVVVLDTFLVMPAGSDPEVIVQEMGGHPPLAWMAAEYALFTVPTGKLVVVIAILATHGEASSNTRSRGNGGVFIIPCWRECGNSGEIAEVSELIRGF